MRITILAVGKIKEKYLRDGIAEFVKRLGPFCRLEIKELDEERMPDDPSAAQKEQALAREGERLLKQIPQGYAPPLAALQSEYEALQAQKEALYADYGKLKKKVREYDIIKQNIDSILQADRQPEREKETERG